jgi:NAD(P)-dependent dehydrogenase (short-subunit alcohol dehydrogenase family)
MGRYYPKDPGGVQGKSRWLNYGTTKLDNLLFTFELERRLKAAGTTTIAVAAHPGWAQSNLAASGPLMGLPMFFGRLGRVAGHFGQSTENGALPTLYAATAPEVRGGQYAGPSGPGQQFGPPRIVGSNKASKSLEDAASLWAASEELTGVTYRFS